MIKALDLKLAVVTFPEEEQDEMRGVRIGVSTTESADE